MKMTELIEKTEEIIEKYKLFNKLMSTEEVIQQNPDLCQHEDSHKIQALRHEREIWVDNHFSMASVNFTYGIRIGNKFPKKTELVNELMPLYKELATMVEYGDHYDNSHDVGVFHVSEYINSIGIGVAEKGSVYDSKLEITERIKRATAL